MSVNDLLGMSIGSLIDTLVAAETPQLSSTFDKGGKKYRVTVVEV